MTIAEATRAIRNHAIVLGARLDGFDVWFCRESGNVLICITEEELDKREDLWDGELETRPSRWEKHLHPTQSAECNGLTCGHEPFRKVKRLAELQRAKETLDEIQRKTRELDQNK